MFGNTAYFEATRTKVHRGVIRLSVGGDFGMGEWIFGQRRDVGVQERQRIPVC